MDLLDSLGTLAKYPAISIAPALTFGFMYLIARKRLLLATATVWALYVLYEFGMKFRLLCSGDCNIRVDLLLLYPILFVVSAVSLIVFLGHLRRQAKRGSGETDLS